MANPVCLDIIRGPGPIGPNGIGGQKKLLEIVFSRPNKNRVFFIFLYILLAGIRWSCIKVLHLRGW